MFGFNKEKSILKKIRQKKAQIDKLKEEINKMAKLVIKDGKLQKVETNEQVKVEEQATEKLQKIVTPPIRDVPAMESATEEDYVEEEEAVMPVQQEMPMQRITQEQQIYLQQQQRMRMQQEQIALMQQVEQQRQQAQHQAMMQQQMLNQQTYEQQQMPQQYAEPEEDKVNIAIDLHTGDGVVIALERNVIPSFYNDVMAHIANKTAMVINGEIINAQYIVKVHEE